LPKDPTYLPSQTTQKALCKLDGANANYKACNKTFFYAFPKHVIDKNITLRNYSVSQKNIPDIFSYSSRKHCQIFIIFGTRITEKVGNQYML